MYYQLSLAIIRIILPIVISTSCFSIKCHNAGTNINVLLTGEIVGVIPFTNYTVKMSACTMAGCTESSDGVHVVTSEEGTYMYSTTSFIPMLGRKELHADK